jgi:hypothetical protein
MKKRITPELMSTILDAGYNIDYIDCATIEKLGALPYPVLIIPPTERIPLSTWRKISKYSAITKVIAIGKLPSRAPGVSEQSTSAEIASLSQSLFKSPSPRGIFIDSLDNLPTILHLVLKPDIDVSGQTEGLGFIHRKLADSDIYFLANTGNAKIDGLVQFRAHRSNFEMWDIDSGNVVSGGKHAYTDALPLNLAPYESRVFVLSDRPGIAKPEDTSKRGIKSTDLSSGWQIRFANSNANQALNNLGSWTELQDKQFYSGEADYTRNFDLAAAPRIGTRFMLDFGGGEPTVDTRPPGANGTHALLDPPIREAAIVLVNGRRVGSLWHPPYRIDISSFVRAGANRLEVRVFNTAVNEMAGRPPRDFSELYAKFGKRFEMQDMENLIPVPSGLIGNVSLLVESKQ